MNIQDWSPLWWTGWISLQSKRLARVFSSTTVQKHQFFSTQLSSQSNSHIHTWPHFGKTIALTRLIFVGKVISLLFNMLYRLTAYYKRVGFSKLRTPPLQHLTPHVQMSSISPCSVVWELGLRKPVQMLTFWIMLFPRVVKFFGPGVSCLLPPPMKLWQANLEVYKCGSILDLSQLVT